MTKENEGRIPAEAFINPESATSYWVKGFRGRYRVSYISLESEESILNGIYDQALQELYHNIFGEPEDRNVDDAAWAQQCQSRLSETLDSICRGIYWAREYSTDKYGEEFPPIDPETVRLLQGYIDNLTDFYRIILADPKFSHTLDPDTRREFESTDFYASKLT